MRAALLERRLELGTVKALAAELGLSESATGRMLRRGPPSTWDDARLERFAEQLYAKAHAAAVARSPGARDVLAAKRKVPAYSMDARVAAIAPLEAALVDLERRAKCEPGSWTPRAELARELGVTSVRLGRWLSSGNVPEESMPRALEWAQQRADAELRRISLKARVGDIIQASKSPAFAHGLPGAPVRQAARAPDMKTGEGPTQSEQHSGYEWVRRVEQWSSFELIDEMCAWASQRQRRGPMYKPAHRWIVTAFVSIYEPDGLLRQRRGNRKRRSPGGHRQFERQGERELGRSIELGAVVSSRSVHRGGLKLAVERFREAMTIEHCDSELMFVHSVLVRNWRERTPLEKKNWRERDNAKFWAKERAKARADEAAKAAVREGARAEALGRGRSRAGGARTRGKKKRT